MSVTIGGIAIGGDNPCRFVGEMSNAHGGSLPRMLRMISAAKDSGVDYIKTQCFVPSELVTLRGDGPAPEPWGSQGRSMLDLYTEAATPFEWFPAINEYCRDLEIPWFSSVFGPESLAHVIKHGACAIKIARLDNANAALAGAVREAGMPLVLSSIAGEYDASHTPDVLLYCPPGYPQAAFAFERPYSSNGDYQWGTFDEADGFDGFSYHGTSIEPPIVAATLGAKVIEAHFMLRDEPSKLESNVSLDEYQFAEMIQRVRAVERMIA